MVNINKTVLCALCLSVMAAASAQYRVVYDPYCLKAVTTNLASQKAIESKHNQRLDSIASKQNKIRDYTVSMATLEELYNMSMENISGFGTESKYYIEIGACALDILKDMPVVIQAVTKSKIANKALCLKELGDVTLKCQQLVADYVNIVNNAKVENPLKGQATAEKKSDGANLLDRYERLTVAHTIYKDLLDIRYRLQAMVMMARYGTRNDLLFAMDPEGWANIMTAKSHVSTLILSWNRIME